MNGCHKTCNIMADKSMVVPISSIVGLLILYG